jgi:hypothetical protein
LKREERQEVNERDRKRESERERVGTCFEPKTFGHLKVSAILSIFQRIELKSNKHFDF